MKQAGKFKPVMNLFEWLPPQGELRTALRFDGIELCIEVFYEDESDATEKSRTIIFTGVCSFFTSSTPGVNLLGIHYDKVAMDGSLVEFAEKRDRSDIDKMGDPLLDSPDATHSSRG